MPTPRPQLSFRLFLHRLVRYFVQGMIILAPIGITLYAMYWLFEQIDQILRPYLNVPGLGFVLIILGVILIGWVSSIFLVGSFFNLLDQWLDRAPGIKFIYTSTKELFEAFAGDKRKFKTPVLASVFEPDVWVVGFLTDEEMQKFNMGEEHVAVYVPQAYNFAGQLYVLPRTRIKKIDRIPSGDAMKYAVTGGVAELESEKKNS
ncbi:MAG: DUF502 domain-containing protein [Bacteroidetes bacterium]|nr:DUF502 domain-containing protein [Bacteroidota bacterium]